MTATQNRYAEAAIEADKELPIIHITRDFRATPAQLLRVPSTRRPTGSSAVFMRPDPVAGPSTAKGVKPVIRRLRRPPRT